VCGEEGCRYKSVEDVSEGVSYPNHLFICYVVEVSVLTGELGIKKRSTYYTPAITSSSAAISPLSLSHAQSLHRDWSILNTSL
jgi:hypothetical protein